MNVSCDLTQKKCLPCEGGIPKLTPTELAELMPQLKGWEVREDKLLKSLTFADFAGAMRFVNQMAELAEEEGHHPDFYVHFNRVDVSIWTHAVGGLTENDFVLAAKLDALQS